MHNFKAISNFKSKPKVMLFTDYTESSIHNLPIRAILSDSGGSVWQWEKRQGGNITTPGFQTSIPWNFFKNSELK